MLETMGDTEGPDHANSVGQADDKLHNVLMCLGSQRARGIIPGTCMNGWVEGDSLAPSRTVLTRQCLLLSGPAEGPSWLS